MVDFSNQFNFVAMLNDEDAALSKKYMRKIATRGNECNFVDSNSELVRQMRAEKERLVIVPAMNRLQDFMPAATPDYRRLLA